MGKPEVSVVTRPCCSSEQDLSVGHAGLGASPWQKHLPTDHRRVPAQQLPVGGKAAQNKHLLPQELPPKQIPI